MVVKSGFFMSVNGDRRYDAAFFAEYFASFIGNGVFPNPSTNLQVVEGSNMQTIVKQGKGWINGYYVHNDSDYVMQHDIADGVLKRIDRIVLQWNYLTRQIVIVVKKGTFASSPVAPVLVRNTDYYELALADVYIGNGVTKITQANITDQRLNSALCGIVTQTVKTVDTTTLFNQYQSWIDQQKAIYTQELELWTADQRLSFEDWMSAQHNDFADWRQLEEQEFTDWMLAQKTAFTDWMQQEQSNFDAWFESLQNILDGDVAGNLLTLIEQNKTDITQINDVLNTLEDDYNTFKATKGQTSGLATLDDTKNIPVDELGNVQYLKDFYGRKVLGFDITKKSIHELIAIGAEVELFKFTPIVENIKELFKTDYNNYTSINDTEIVSSSYSAGGYSVISSIAPFDLTEIDTVVFKCRKPDSESNGESLIGFQQKIDTTYSSYDVKQIISPNNNVTEVSMDVSNLTGEHYLKISSKATTTTFNRLYVSGIKFINKKFIISEKSSPLKLKDRLLSASTVIPFDIVHNFLDWFSLNALVDTPNGSNIRFDIYDNYDNLLKGDVKNGETFQDFTEPKIKIKVTLSRNNENIPSPTLSWFELGMRGLGSTLYSKIAQLTLEEITNFVEFSNLSYKQLKVLIDGPCVTATNGRGELLIRVNDILSNYNSTTSYFSTSASGLSHGTIDHIKLYDAMQSDSNFTNFYCEIDIICKPNGVVFNSRATSGAKRNILGAGFLKKEIEELNKISLLTYSPDYKWSPGTTFTLLGVL